MKKLLLISTAVLGLTAAYGQKYGNVWQFGYNTGIDFNSCNPIIITGNNIGFEGCSSICDSTGQLIFYTNSDIVWNRLNNQMPNGTLINSNGTLSQVIIIPKPGCDSLYYIVTTKIQAAGSLSLQYHTINMNLNGGLGDVISKNNILSTANITEQICATYNGNGNDIWLMAHEYATNNFLCYLVSSSGINSTPVISGVGIPISACNSNMNARGELKFSPDGKKVAINNNGSGDYPNSDVLSVFDFNNNTGIVSNPINLPPERGGFGLSFSSDNSKLYGTTWKALNFTSNDSNKVFQFDLSSGNPTTIANSKVILYSAPLTQKTFGVMKLAPDGKIYVTSNNCSYLGVINNPNIAGLNCNYVNNGLYLNGYTGAMGLNNYIEYKTYCNNSGISDENQLQNKINIFPNPFSTQTTFQTDNPFHNATLTVDNCFGQTVAQIKNISGQTITFNRDNLASGLYFVRLTEQNKTIAVDKLVIADK